eukprot:RCo027117
MQPMTTVCKRNARVAAGAAIGLFVLAVALLCLLSRGQGHQGQRSPPVGPPESDLAIFGAAVPLPPATVAVSTGGASADPLSPRSPLNPTAGAEASGDVCGDSQHRTLWVDGNEVFAVDTGNSGESASPAPHVVLLLHGMRFSHSSWCMIGTVGFLHASGYRVIAVDIPGYGRSPAPQRGLSKQFFLKELLGALQLSRVVVVSPSFSGSFVFPVLLRKPELFGGFVPIAPTMSLSEAEVGSLSTLPVRTLVLWGEKDSPEAHRVAQLLSQIPGSTRHMFPGAGHACYLDSPENWHTVLLRFLKQLRA